MIMDGLVYRKDRPTPVLARTALARPAAAVTAAAAAATAAAQLGPARSGPPRPCSARLGSARAVITAALHCTARHGTEQSSKNLASVLPELDDITKRYTGTRCRPRQSAFPTPMPSAHWPQPGGYSAALPPVIVPW